MHRGKHLYELRLSGTFITERGLELLSGCPNLRSLHLARCWNITNKAQANQALMPALKKMKHLRELVVSDSRLSGRMLSENRDLRLVKLCADRCPFSVHALRMLAGTSQKTMQTLSLSG
jgi:hypothetical protein